MGNKKVKCDQRERFLLFLVALTPLGITAGNPLDESQKSKVESFQSPLCNRNLGEQNLQHFKIKYIRSPKSPDFGARYLFELG